MKGSASLVHRLPTEADVIAWLQADYRIRVGIDPEVEGDAVLTAETTIADWRAACDLVSARRLAGVMNDWFQCERSTHEWLSVLEPEETRTLGGLARFAAPHMRMPDFQPISVGGASNAASGAFFALRGLLSQKGVDLATLRPSTPISSLTTEQVVAVGSALAMLAPDATPIPAIIPKRRQQVGVLFVVGGVLLLILGAVASSGMAAWAAALGITVGLFLGRGLPDRTELGNYRTIGDIARAVASQRDDAA